MIPKANNKVCMLKSQMKTILITFFNNKNTVHYELIPQNWTVNQAYHVEILKQLHKAVCKKKKGLNFGPTIGFSTMAMLQLTRCYQAVPGLKINYWYRTPALFPWFGSKWLLFAKVKSALMNISGYWRHPNKCDKSTESYSTT
jgi:hypothetical protein